VPTSEADKLLQKTKNLLNLCQMAKKICGL